MAEIDFSCVIPAYNEEKCVRAVLEEIFQTLNRKNFNYEVIVIDNGSVDKTTEILDDVKKSVPQLKVVRLDPNRGYGGAILHGLSVAQGNVVGFTAADGEVSPNCMIQMYDMIQTGHLDMCKAKRINRLDGARRKIFSFGYHLIVTILFKIHITDVNGYPVFMTRQAYQRFRLTKTDCTISLELLYQARQLGLTTVELDVPHRMRMGGQSHIRWRSVIKMFRELLFIWWEVHSKRAPLAQLSHPAATKP